MPAPLLFWGVFGACAYSLFKPKRRRQCNNDRLGKDLCQVIPGLPDDMALKVLYHMTLVEEGNSCQELCSSNCPSLRHRSRSHSHPLASMSLVCRNWRTFVRKSEAFKKILATSEAKRLALKKRREEDWQQCKQKLGTFLVSIAYLGIPPLLLTVSHTIKCWISPRSARKANRQNRYGRLPLLDLKIMLDGCLLFLVEETHTSLVFCPHPPFFPVKCVKWVVGR